MPLRLETLHNPLSSPDWLVRVLRSIVQAFVGAMLDTRHDLSLCGVAGTKLVSDHHAWGDTLVLEQLAHQTQGGCLVPSALQQGIEHIAISIDRAYAKGVTLDFSRPDKLTDNEFIEAFNGSFRAECPRP